MLVLAVALLAQAQEDPGILAPEHDVLWDAYLRSFEPEVLGVDAVPCSTGLVMELEAHWELFTPAERVRITAHVAPFKRDLLDPMPQVLDGDVPVLPSVPDAPVLRAPTTTCWGPQAENVVTSDHFSVEWDGDLISESTARAFAEALETSWSKEFDTLGWNTPDGTDDYLIMALVQSGGAGAYTTVSQCGGVYMPYIVAGDASFSRGTWYRDMAGHELIHASQFSYGYSYEFWFWEATATYMQDQIFPTSEWWSTYVTGYSQKPWIAMSASDQRDQDIFYHMYGMCIWLNHIDEKYNGPDYVRQMWDFGGNRGRAYELSQDQVLSDLGNDFDLMYDTFIVANTVMDYDEQRYYPEIVRSDRVDSLPAEGDQGRNPVGPYGQQYIWFDTTVGSNATPDLRLVFDGEADGEWTAWVVGVNGKDITDSFSIPLVDDAGEVRVPNIVDYDDLYLVVSPRNPDAADWRFFWEAEAIEAEVVEDTDVSEETDVAGDSDVEVVNGSCACGSVQLAGGVPLVAGLIGVVARRRRRA
jgi:hypothetical protein